MGKPVVRFRSSIAIVLLSALIALAGSPLAVQSGRGTPPPLKVHISQEQAWDTMQELLRQREYSIIQESRARGQILTDFRQYMTGPLTAAHLRKISQVRKLSDGSWVQAEYQYEVHLELLESRETLVSVFANIRGLKRDYFGNETWVDIPSNGGREEDLLTLFGRRLFGEDFRLDEPKKGFWEHAPQYVPDLERTIPRIASPERP